MSQLNDLPLSELHFYLTAPYPCGYLPGVWASSQVAAPSLLIDNQVYAELVQHGFRRSGAYTYRPHCDGCNACVPLRVSAGEFTANRAQRRAWKQHAHLHTGLHGLQDKQEYYDLYHRYQRVRHPEGDMDNCESYLNLLLKSQVDSMLVEFREDEQLRMVSVIDLLSDGLSSVYTFYEPDLPSTCFGVYNVLWQIALCRQLKLDYVYLGYWIKHSRKMAYKVAYQPAQGLINGAWEEIDRNGLIRNQPQD